MLSDAMYQVASGQMPSSSTISLLLEVTQKTYCLTEPSSAVQSRLVCHGPMLLLYTSSFHYVFCRLFYRYTLARLCFHLVNAGLEIARLFGSDCTPNGIRFQVTDRLKYLGKRQSDYSAAGKDPKDIDLSGGSHAERNSKGQIALPLPLMMEQAFSCLFLMIAFQFDLSTLLIAWLHQVNSDLEMAKIFGSDCTPGGLGRQWHGPLRTLANANSAF